MRVAYGWQPDTMFGTAPLWQANIASDQTLQTAQVHYLYTDHLGTPVMAVNAKGQVTWKGQHEAFGKVLADEGNQIVMNLRFPGQYYDQETDSHYNYMRDYNPELGRYQQRDPIGLAGGINSFGYANSNPLLYRDPQGLFAPAIPAIYLWLAGGGTVAYGMYSWQKSGHTVTLPMLDDRNLQLLMDILMGPGVYIGRYVVNSKAGTAEEGCDTDVEDPAAVVDKDGKKISPIALSISSPGNCDPDEHKKMQAEVEGWCRPHSTIMHCRGEFSPNIRAARAEANRQCAMARDRLNNICFAGGNLTHRDQAIDAWKRFAECQ